MTDEDILNIKKENVGNLSTFQEKFIILCNNGYKVWKNRKKIKIQIRSLENNFFLKNEWRFSLEIFTAYSIQLVQ